MFEKYLVNNKLKGNILIYPKNTRDTNLIAVYRLSRKNVLIRIIKYFAESADFVANMMIQIPVNLNIVTHTKYLLGMNDIFLHLMLSK